MLMKRCRQCQKNVPVEEFVDTSGKFNPKGAYCRTCHLQRLDEWRQAALAEEASHIPKLKIVYGKWWKHYAVPEDFYHTLLEERDTCPYCGTKFTDVLPNNFNPSLIHLDHMDPLQLGGEHSIRNVVYCCGCCNIKKGKLSFVKWLEKLEPAHRNHAKQVYVEKHGHPPEEFEEGIPGSRGSWPEMVIDETEAELRERYLEPIVTGPPSNKPIVITIDVKVAMEKALAELHKKNNKKA